MNGLKIHFWLFKAKINSNGVAPIYMRVTQNKKRFQMSTGVKISPNLWGSKMNKVLGNSESTKAYNSLLTSLKTKTILEYSKLILEDSEVSIHKLKDRITNKNATPDFLQLFKKHNERIALLVGKEYSIETLLIYQRTNDRLKEFIQYQYGREDIQLSELNREFISNFDLFLRTQRSNTNNTVFKSIQRIKKVIKLAINSGYMTRDPFVTYNIKKERKEIIYLTKGELAKLESKSFQLNRLDIIKDMFVFCCYTGLAYREVKSLTTDSIITGIDGKEWLNIYRHKTKKSYKLPLLKKAKDLLKRYEDKNRHSLLPVPSNVKFNAYLKEVADLCGIKKNLTTHIARKTFATTVTLLNDVPMETVSFLLGHSSISITQESYSQVVDKKIANDLTRLDNRLLSD